MNDPDRHTITLMCDSRYIRFLDRVLKKIREGGADLKPKDYPKLFELALTALAARDYSITSPPRVPSRGGARPGAGRPPKSAATSAKDHED